MGRRTFTPEFKLEAVKLVTERGMSRSQAARDLGIHVNVLRNWVEDFKRDPKQAGTVHYPLANDTRYGLQAAIFTADLGVALRAATTLDFGGVLVNEVPTFRTDQMPYGGVRDSGNTKEGPHWSVREMTEERLVILQP